MFSKIIIFFVSAIILCSCVTGPREYFKKSANNKLFDTKGFKGAKRAPLYNKRYIAKAKQNVAAYDYDSDDDDDDDMDQYLESENIPRANRDMYRYMLEQDVESKYLGKNARKRNNKAYPSVVQTSTKLDDTDYIESLQLRAELDQIKAMLSETRKEMASYRCPTAMELEQAGEKQTSEVLMERNLGKINQRLNRCHARTRTRKIKIVL